MSQVVVPYRARKPALTEAELRAIRSYAAGVVSAWPDAARAYERHACDPRLRGSPELAFMAEASSGAPDLPRRFRLRQAVLLAG